MKIERVNDHQIRCTLTRSDLADRQLKISELAYGTEKAKSLFNDMMRQAKTQFGFDAENIPLMIEAIPMNADCIVLVITKVEDPEELDTRFSSFAPDVSGNSNPTEELLQSLTGGADSILDLFKRIHEGKVQNKNTGDAGMDVTAGQDANADPLPAAETRNAHDKEASKNKVVTQFFSFDSLSTLSRMAKIVGSPYPGTGRLFKDSEENRYLLSLNNSSCPGEYFTRICHIASEYGEMLHLSDALDAYCDEHYDLLLEGSVLETLAQI